MNLKQWLIAGIVAALAVSACSPETRYRTLSFFFDGVPQPEELETKATNGNKTEKDTEEKTAKTKKISHGPYAAKMCQSCHRKGGGKLLLPVEELCFKCHDLNIQKRRVHGPVASGGCRVCHHPHGTGRQFNLVAEPTTFCFYCHEKAEIMSHDFHQESAGTQCTVCHNPHASDSDYLLKNKTGVKDQASGEGIQKPEMPQ